MTDIGLSNRPTVNDRAITDAEIRKARMPNYVPTRVCFKSFINIYNHQWVCLEMYAPLGFTWPIWFKSAAGKTQQCECHSWAHIATKEA